MLCYSPMILVVRSQLDTNKRKQHNGDISLFFIIHVKNLFATQAITLMLVFGLKSIQKEKIAKTEIKKNTNMQNNHTSQSNAGLSLTKRIR